MPQVNELAQLIAKAKRTASDLDAQLYTISTRMLSTLETPEAEDRSVLLVLESQTDALIEAVSGMGVALAVKADYNSRNARLGSTAKIEAVPIRHSLERIEPRTLAHTFVPIKITYPPETPPPVPKRPVPMRRPMTPGWWRRASQS